MITRQQRIVQLRPVFSIASAVLLLLASITAAVLMFVRRPTPSVFRHATSDLPVRLPRDAAAHFDTHTEWWYYTGFLSGPLSREMGFELVFFKVYMPPAKRLFGVIPLHWVSNPHTFAQLAFSDPEQRRHEHFERAELARFGPLGSTESLRHISVGDWCVEQREGRHRLQVHHHPYELALDLTAVKPPVLHGERGDGVIPMGQAGTSYYYSYTDLRGTGTLQHDGSSRPVNARVWMDHQWGSWNPKQGYTGWDWFALQLENGCEAMIFNFRDDAGRWQPQSFATWVDRQGRASHLKSGEFTVIPRQRWTSPQTGTTYPIKWSVAIPAYGLDTTVEAAFPDQEMILAEEGDYWEGMVRLSGTIGGKGYVELAGYADDQ